MKKQILTLGAVLLFAVSGFAQNPAALDPSFDPESNTSGVVESIALQPDGKILVTGHFSSRIARLNTDGSLDDSFHQPELWSAIDRKSTRLNSSHVRISYAVFCLKKKKKKYTEIKRSRKSERLPMMPECAA